MNNLLKRIRYYPRFGLIMLAYIAFIALGMPDGLLGVAWPSIRHGFGVPLDALGYLWAVSITGYILSAFFSGRVTAWLGVGKVLAISCLMTGIGLIGYTLVPQWWMMVALGILSGLGAGAIDTGLNAYVEAHFNPGLMQWLHACYGIGITGGPLIMTYGLNAFANWRPGYIVVGTLQLILALVFTLTLPKWKDDGATGNNEKLLRETGKGIKLGETLREGQVWMGLIQFLLYVGSEVSIGTWTYTLLTESRNIEPEIAGLLTGSYWGMFTVGRIIAGLFARRIGINKLVLGSLVLAFIASLLLWWNPAEWSNIAAIAMVGLAIAPIFPALVSGTSQRVGEKHAANTIGIQMAASGLAAVVIALVGVLARRISLEIIPLCLVVLFGLQIGIYVTGMRQRRKKINKAIGQSIKI